MQTEEVSNDQSQKVAVSMVDTAVTHQKEAEADQRPQASESLTELIAIEAPKAVAVKQATPGFTLG